MTIYLADIFDLDLLEQMLDEGMVKRSIHPNGDLALLNYTPQAQYSKTWNAVTTACRGLIYRRHDLSVVARPFEKFFNLGEHDVTTLPDEPYRVFEKMDGSLGILYHDGEGWAIATRGSFTSDQAIWATDLLRTKYPLFNPDPAFTYLYEIIYPSNRIVVDYGGMEDLVLLDVIETATGKQAWDREWFAWDGPWVEEHDVVLDEITSQERPNHEGYVLVYRSGLRVKIKHSEYVAMHGIVTNTSSRTVWEFLSQGKDLAMLLDNVPDEFADWARDVATELEFLHDQINDHVYEVLQEVKDSLPENWTRKDFAEAVKNDLYRGLLFLALDGRSLDEQIWKMIRPERTLPFRDEAAA